ncbi:MAG: alpha/beta fold hydrolase [Phycisphaerae bacterium]|nr:alpha/beta fold hydrolase [Gemmatimonadaceae bacterium]
MRLALWISAASFATLTAVIPVGAGLSAQVKPTFEQFFSPASPLMLASAKKADRVAWMTYDRGLRNVYTAAAPAFTPVRLTNFMQDDGTDLSDVELSDDGSIIVFVRGSAPNRFGWVANPNQDPNGAERAIWAVRAGGGPAWRVAEGSAPVLSPDGKWVLYTKNNEIYRARVARGATQTSMDTGGVPFIREWGRSASPMWSPDGSKIAFVSSRENHAFIAVYDVATRKVKYMAPGVDCDGTPTWSPDSKRIAFSRRPGTPFGLQAQAGQGGIGSPAGVAVNATAAASAAAAGVPLYNAGCGGGAGAGRGGGGGGRGGVAATPDTPGRSAVRSSPGFYSAAFSGGHTLLLMIADATTGVAKEVWHNAPRDSVFTSFNNMRWANNEVVFPVTVPRDEWERWYSLSVDGGTPVRLTKTDGMIEDNTSIALSSDGKTFFYCTNAGDIERRHIFAVPTTGGTPRRISMGNGIETYPQPLGSGKNIAVIYYDAKTPASIGIVPIEGSEPKLIFPKLTSNFPTAAHVMPEIVMTKAPDGVEVHNQLFLPKDMKPGEKRPALIFVHGGPQRQMMPGYHYFQFYHWAYGYNQFLADQGYVVLSINFRGGVGYGRTFRNAPNTNSSGNSEYQDVLAGAKYLQARADVDPKRVGIWGLSYGGLLTAEALARNSDIFTAGVDIAGVHLYSNVLDTAAVAFKSSAVGAMDGWKSPVLLVHGDDDRNVDFAQTVGLVQLLRARGVYHEVIVVPDDLHESMIHKNWVDTFNRMTAFLKRFVWDKEPAPKAAPN